MRDLLELLQKHQVSLADLIRAKREAGRSKDRLDIEELGRVRGR